MLTLDTLVPNLIQRGLFAPESVLDGEVSVTAEHRRNHNLRVRRKDGPGLFVKQPGTGSSAAQTLQREGGFFVMCASEAGMAPIHAYLPHLVLFDPETPVLGLELIEGAVPLWEHYGRTPGQVPSEAPRALGTALGAAHRLLAPAARPGDPRGSWLPATPPWVLRLHRPAPELRSSLSRAQQRLLQILQTDTRLAAAFDAVGETWTPGTLVHGDIRSDNALVVATKKGAVQVRLIDWELVQVGDPAWDVAGALHDFLVFWTTTFPPAGTPEQRAGAAGVPLAAIQPAVRAFWGAYRNAWRGADGAGVLERAVRFSAVRLIQSAFEMSQTHAALADTPILLLQLGANLLRDPRAGREHLYGLLPEETR
ncbi:MAG TPA: phosphotransferase [Longimicrobium sp.]|nr:phosphotransferase [Longimicrobium sp.]